MPTPRPRRPIPSRSTAAKPAVGPAARRRPAEPTRAAPLESLLPFDSSEDVIALPPTRILSNDPQRAVPTNIYRDLEPAPLSDEIIDPALESAETAVRRLSTETVEIVTPQVRITRAFLYVDRGPSAGSMVPVPEGETLIGRATECTFRIDHPSVSRQHCVVRRTGNRFFIRDLKSHNGTFLNGRPIATECELTGGDELTIGRAVIVLRAEAPAAQPQATSRTSVKLPLTSQPWFPFAAFATALGLGLGAALAYVSYRSAPRPAPTAKVETAPADNEVTIVVEESPAAKAEAAPVVKPVGHDEIALAPGEVSATAVFDEAKSKPVPARKFVKPAPRVAAAKPAARPAKKVAAASAPAPSANDAPAMAKYEAGDVASAIELAAGNPRLSESFRSFQGEVAAAKASMKGNDGAGAIKHYTKALAIDQQLSKGWSKQSGEIRSQLAKLYIAAAKQVMAKNPSAAQKYAEKAMDYDPSSDEAEKLADQAEKAAGSDARSAADAAFGE